MTEKGTEEENWTRARKARGRAPFLPLPLQPRFASTCKCCFLGAELTKKNTALVGNEILPFLVLDAQANLQTVDLSEINADIAVAFFFF